MTTIGFISQSVSAMENDGQAILTIGILSGSLLMDISVQISLIDGSAVGKLVGEGIKGRGGEGRGGVERKRVHMMLCLHVLEGRGREKEGAYDVMSACFAPVVQ